MSHIKTFLAAGLAKDVYLLTDPPLPPRKIAGKSKDSIGDKILNTGYREIRETWGKAIIDLEGIENNVTKGVTGGPAFLKSKTAFGLCVLGKGAYKGHAFFVFRGTRYLGDWLTNFNVGTTRSSLGHQVHDGFRQAFESMGSVLNHLLENLLRMAYSTCIVSAIV